MGDKMSYVNAKGNEISMWFKAGLWYVACKGIVFSRFPWIADANREYNRAWNR